MDDKELADAALKILDGYVLCTLRLQYVFSEKIEPMIDEDFVRDWRVAGALMEKVPCLEISAACKQSDGLLYHGWLKDPRKIIEVCVKALS